MIQDANQTAFDNRVLDTFQMGIQGATQVFTAQQAAKGLRGQNLGGGAGLIFLALGLVVAVYVYKNG